MEYHWAAASSYTVAAAGCLREVDLCKRAEVRMRLAWARLGEEQRKQVAELDDKFPRKAFPLVEEN